MLIIFMIHKLSNKSIVETIAKFWFKLACSIFLLYILQLILSKYGVFIPINPFTILVVIILGIPGYLLVGIVFYLV